MLSLRSVTKRVFAVVTLTIVNKRYDCLPDFASSSVSLGRPLLFVVRTRGFLRYLGREQNANFFLAPSLFWPLELVSSARGKRAVRLFENIHQMHELYIRLLAWKESTFPCTTLAPLPSSLRFVLQLNRTREDVFSLVIITLSVCHTVGGRCRQVVLFSAHALYGHPRCTLLCSSLSFFFLS